MVRESHKSLIEKGLQLEKEGEPEKAIQLYLDVVKKDHLNAAAYNRLMVLYRKQKAPRKEIAIINEAIKAYEDNVKAEQSAWSKKNRKAASISRELVKALGLVDKKGAPVNQPAQIVTWKKRKENVSKKLAHQ
ncbi:tetratricopeptide repeat protein [Chitinophaga sp. 22536]|uniref:tetratricopeptide repeat protein n=1 Tax=unclassified Chitinophaga TaxID=2619133 RepID=UPI0031CF519D